MAAAATAGGLRLEHGVGGGGIPSGLPVLAGEAAVFPASSHLTFERRGPWLSAESGEQIIGAITASLAHGRISDTIHGVYRDLFTATEGWSLYRIWTFVPRINRQTDGLENYQAFCVGRYEAFRGQFGDAAQEFMPAASAVGTDAPDFVAWFVGGRSAGTNIENPLQIPAYRYPAIHSPQPPAFSRATRVESARRLFVSGTSSIRGHTTMEPKNVGAQLEVTLENLREVFQVSRVSPEEGRSSCATVYLRQAADLDLVRDALRRDGLFSRTTMTFLRADICRSELDIEIECDVNF